MPAEAASLKIATHIETPLADVGVNAATRVEMNR